jgi:hypothetical protein
MHKTRHLGSNVYQQFKSLLCIKASILLTRTTVSQRKQEYLLPLE